MKNPIFNWLNSNISQRNFI